MISSKITWLGNKTWCFLFLQIAGDMLCADQNFDIAQVLRFFKSKVRYRPGTVGLVQNSEPTIVVNVQDSNPGTVGLLV